MQAKITYKGILNGIHGLWCGFKPENLEVEEEITVYYPDAGKVFVKDGEKFSVVVIKDGVRIEDFTEVDEIPDEEERE